MNDNVLMVLNNALKKEGREGLLPELLLYAKGSGNILHMAEKLQTTAHGISNTLKKNNNIKVDNLMEMLELLGFELAINYRHRDTISVLNKPRSHMLGVVYPVVHKFWHPTKNGQLTPNMIPANSRPSAWFACSKGHEWRNTTNELIKDIKWAFIQMDISEDGYNMALASVCPECRKS